MTMIGPRTTRKQHIENIQFQIKHNEMLARDGETQTVRDDAKQRLIDLYAELKRAESKVAAPPSP